ncbi:MAG: hypothetical protein ACTS85_00180 [Arsenophonus sp. NC-PG7-MAG3]
MWWQKSRCFSCARIRHSKRYDSSIASLLLFKYLPFLSYNYCHCLLFMAYIPYFFHFKSGKGVDTAFDSIVAIGCGLSRIIAV